MCAGHMKKLLTLGFLPSSTDLGLLVLRVWLGGSVLLLHGWAKLTGFSQMAKHFMDPLKIGAKYSLGLATFAEVLCAALVVLGLFTRLSALILAINLGVAFSLVHHFVLHGAGSGEVAFVYLAAFVTIFLCGGGRFSLDGKGGSSKGSGSAPKKPSKPKE
jgi:putative oxidoreductase